MNLLEDLLDWDVKHLLDRVASTVPAGGVADAVASPALRRRLDEAEKQLGAIRATLLEEFGRWNRALDDLENLWALAAWRSAAAQEPVEESAGLAA